MLEHFSIENFKGYEGRYDFDFPGLTFLTGANNSGKSSIIQALYMLASSNSNNFYATLLTNTTNYNYGGFKDLLNKNCRSTDNIKFDLCWEDLNMSEKYGNNEIENYNPVIEELKISIDLSTSYKIIDMKNLDDERKLLSIRYARKIQELSDEDFQKIKAILGEDN